MTVAYEERYCAFVDILGFSELVAQLRGGTVTAEKLYSLLQQIHASDHANIFLDLKAVDLRAQSISDAVVISTKRNPVGLAILFYSLSSLSLGLLYEGYFVRGAICKGPLFHDERMVFGEALIRAYRLESEVARYPRIMITRDIVQDAEESFMKEPLLKNVRQAEDGPYFLHVLLPLSMALEQIRTRDWEAGEPEPDLAYFATIRQMIQQRFAESVDTPKHFEKVQWFARYWNSSIIRIRKQVDRISGPGLDQGPALSGYQ